MKNLFLIYLAFFTLTFSACQKKGDQEKLEKTHKSAILNVDVKDFNNALLKTKGILVDVRTPEEFAESHIPGSINIDWKNQDYFNSEIKKLTMEKPVLIYCRSGQRSGMARDAMKKMGFTTIYNLKHGFLSWDAEKMPVEK